MSPALVDGLTYLSTQGWQDIILLILLAAVRPLGLLYMFIGFSWSMGRSRLLRTTMAIGVALPLLFLNISNVERIYEVTNTPFLLVSFVTELLIGGILGFVISIPFYALGFAGTLTDQFRGETDSGLQSPSGGTISTWSLLYTIIGFFILAQADGIVLIFRALYHTYTIWPILSGLPDQSVTVVQDVLRIFGIASMLGIRLAMPLLFLLVIIELSTYFAARLARRYNFYSLAFPVKNLAALISLPLIAAYASLFFDTQVAKFLIEITLIDLVGP